MWPIVAPGEGAAPVGVGYGCGSETKELGQTADSGADVGCEWLLDAGRARRMFVTLMC